MYTVEEVAQLLNCSESNVRNLIRKGDLVETPIGASGEAGKRVTKANLEAFIEKRTKRERETNPAKSRPSRPLLRHLRLS